MATSGWNQILNGLKSTDILVQASRPPRSGIKVSQDPCLRRITYILSFYQQWLANPQGIFNKGINVWINELSNYDSIALINDFQHILDYHCRNCKNYEKVYQCMVSKLGQPISIEKSICIKRNYRNRSLYQESNEELIKLYLGFNDIAEINMQQILDAMYSYLLYSFDLIRLSPANEKLLKQTVGNILKQENNQDKDNKEQKTASNLDLIVDDSKQNENKTKINLKFLKPLSQIIEKRELQSKIIGSNHVQKNKFLTCVSHKNDNVDECKDNDNDKEDKKENGLLSVDEGGDGPQLVKRSSARVIQESDSQMAYTFGKKWYYWDIYKKNHYTKRDYVAPKYKSLKEEICNNDIYKLSEFQYDILFERAKMISKSSKGQRIIAPPFEDWEDQYEFGIKKGTKINEEQIMSLLLFMNYTELRHHLVSTFTKLEDSNHKKESDRKFKLRHQQFVNFSMKLTEAVLVFGQKMDSFDIFYHNMDIQMIFNKNKLLFFGPTSVTSKLEIAQQYQYHEDMKGLILVLADWYNNSDVDGNDDNGARYFNSSWMSDFVNEQESIFIGADSPIKLATIIKTIKPK